MHVQSHFVFNEGIFFSEGPLYVPVETRSGILENYVPEVTSLLHNIAQTVININGAYNQYFCSYKIVLSERRRRHSVYGDPKKNIMLDTDSATLDAQKRGYPRLYLERANVISAGRLVILELEKMQKLLKSFFKYIEPDRRKDLGKLLQKLQDLFVSDADSNVVKDARDSVAHAAEQLDGMRQGSKGRKKSLEHRDPKVTGFTLIEDDHSCFVGISVDGPRIGLSTRSGYAFIELSKTLLFELAQIVFDASELFDWIHPGLKRHDLLGEPW